MNWRRLALAFPAVALSHTWRENMTTYLCTVKRMQVWRIEVEADNAEAAKDLADALAVDEPLDDEYAYETTARERHENQ